jgi:malate dehydrogenase
MLVRSGLKVAARSLTSSSSSTIIRSMSSSSKKVAVLGASGGIGQPLSLLLKLSPEVGELACYDVVGTPGVAADLSHVSSVHRTTRSFGPRRVPSALAVLCYE